MSLFVPVLVEQTFAVTINLLATIMVRNVSGEAMAGVGLVGILNILVMNAFSAIASGVAVVVSQSIGRRDHNTASESAMQSIVLSTMISIVVGVVMIAASHPLLSLLFGKSDPLIVDAGRIFFVHSCTSMPLLAIFSTIAAILRSTGNSRIPMVASVLSNAFYVAAAYLFINLAGMGVHGAGLAVTISRLIPTLFLVFFMFRGRAGLYLPKLSLKLTKVILSPILAVAIPSAVDSLIFNGGKVLVNVFMANMGNATLEASAICNNLANFLNVPGFAFQAISVTIVGQNYGAGNYREAQRQAVKLTLLNTIPTGVMMVIGLLLLKPIINIFSPSPDTFLISWNVMLLLLIATPLTWGTSFISPQTLRATNDAKFSMWVSVISMIILRVGGSWFFGIHLNMGLLGIWLAMIVDWVGRSVFAVPRMYTIEKRALKTLATSQPTTQENSNE